MHQLTNNHQNHYYINPTQHGVDLSQHNVITNQYYNRPIQPIQFVNYNPHSQHQPNFSSQLEPYQPSVIANAVYQPIYGPQIGFPPTLEQQLEYWIYKLKQITDKLSTEQMLMFYGLYKQFTLGDCTNSRPSIFNGLKARAKHDSWMKYKGVSRETAMGLYIKNAEAVFRHN